MKPFSVALCSILVITLQAAPLWAAPAIEQAPMLLYGSHDIENESVEGTPPPEGAVVIPESNSSDTRLGSYARAGIDFQTDDKQHLGLGIRYMAAELDFSQTIGKLDIEGPQYVLTFTTQL